MFFHSQREFDKLVNKICRELNDSEIIKEIEKNKYLFKNLTRIEILKNIEKITSNFLKNKNVTYSEIKFDFRYTEIYSDDFEYITNCAEKAIKIGDCFYILYGKNLYSILILNNLFIDYEEYRNDVINGKIKSGNCSDNTIYYIDKNKFFIFERNIYGHPDIIFTSKFIPRPKNFYKVIEQSIKIKTSEKGE